MSVYTTVALGTQQRRLGLVVWPGGDRSPDRRRGWPTFTPDGRFVIGESRRVRGFVLAAGCNAHGISGSAGIGRLLVESLFADPPGGYARSLSPDRFTERAWQWATARREAQHVYETYYALAS